MGEVHVGRPSPSKRVDVTSAGSIDDRPAQVLDRLPAVIWTTDTHLEVTSIEGFELGSVGLEPGDVIGRTIDQIFDGGQDPVPGRAHLRAVAGEPVTYAHAWLGRTYEAKLQPRFGDDGRVVGVLGIALDTSERSRLEHALRRALERFEHAQQATRDAIWDWDLATNEVVCGPGLTTFGYEATAIHDGAWWRARLHPADHDRVVASFRSFLDGGGETWLSSFRFQRADGTYADVVDRAHLLRHPDGTPARVIGAISDVTDAKQSERALRASEARFRALVMNAADAIFVIDEAGTIAYVSPGIREMTGYSPDELVGTDGFALVHADDIEAARSAVIEAVEAPARVITLRVRTNHRDGELRHVDARVINLIGDRAVRGIVVNTHDVTPQVEADEARRHLESELERSRRLESIGQLAGGVAHDFNNLLGAILNYAHLVNDALDDDHPARADVDEIRKAAERGASLTQQLLIFGRQDAGSPSVVRLTDVVDGVRTLLHTVVGERVLLELSLGEDVSPVRADPHRLEQILMNLAVNARDAMPDGGVLRVATSEIEVTPDVALAPDLKPGRWVRLTVADTGTGMTPEIRERVFEPFFSTKPVGAGTGLGLATVYGIVKQAEGIIAIDSAPGAGTAFHVYLPAAECSRGAVGGER